MVEYSDSAAIGVSLTDPGAFGVIFERHYDAVHGYLRRRLDPHLADELAAQTFLVAFDGRARFDRGRPDSRPWLFGIATNLARNHRRHEIVELRALAAMAPEASPRPTGSRRGSTPKAPAPRSPPPSPTFPARSRTCSACSSGPN